MEDNDTDLFEEQETAEGQEPAESTETPTQTDPEYFLEVNDRVRYKSADDARKAYDEAGRTIASYSRFGKPDELSSKLERLKLLEQLAGGQKPAGSADPLSDLSPEQQRQWQQYWARNQKLMEANGYVKADQLREQLIPELREQIKRETTETAARAEFARLAQERGIEIPMTAIESAAVALTDEDPELKQQFFAGDGSGFAKRVFERLYGAVKPPKEESRERGADGKFKAAADYQATKDKTKQLKPPPKGNTASADNSGNEEERKKLLDPSYRLLKARKMAEERAA